MLPIKIYHKTSFIGFIHITHRIPWCEHPLSCPVTDYGLAAEISLTIKSFVELAYHLHLSLNVINHRDTASAECHSQDVIRTKRALGWGWLYLRLSLLGVLFCPFVCLMLGIAILLIIFVFGLVCVHFHVFLVSVCCKFSLNAKDPDLSY